MEKQKLIYVESKAQFSPSSVSNKAIVFIKDTKEIWTHGTYFICSNVWATPITLTLSGDSTGSVSIDGSGNVTLSVTNQQLHCVHGSITDANSALSSTYKMRIFSEFAPSFSNGFPASNYANAIININTHSQNYDHQLGFSSNKGIYHRTRAAGTWETSWREILTSTNYTKYPHTFASLTNKPTTISGYGITDSIPIIKGGEVTSSTDLSTLGMTTTGYKFSISYGYTSQPSWLTAYTNLFIFRASSDFYSGIATALSGGHVTFLGGRNAETAPNNVPNWWFRIYGTNGQAYNLANIQTAINNLGSTYLPLTGGTLTDTLILKAGAFTASQGNSYSGGRYQAVSKPNIRLIGDSTYGLSTIEFTSQKGDTSINKPSDSGFIQFQPYGVSALSSVGSHPTLKTSGESNALVLGVTNDSDDIIVLQSPNVSGLRHACGTTEYYLPHVTASTTSINRPLLSTTTAHVYQIGPSALGDAAYQPLSKFVYATSDTYYSYGTTEASGKSSNLTRTQFWRDNDRAMIGVYVQHSVNADYGFELASSYGADSLEYRRKFNGTWGTTQKILTNTNYSTYLNNTYLPLSGGLMTGQIQMTRGSSYLTDTGSTYSMLGMINSGTTTVGMNSEEGMFINVPFTQATLRTSGNNLWHYNHANSARYLILDANNYTNYTIPYAKAYSVTGVMPVINNGNLWYHNNIKFLCFTSNDNHGAASYLLISELTNYETGNTYYVNYGLVGTIYAYRDGNMANTHAYNVSVGASIGPVTFTKVYTSAITDALIPMIVKYDGKYYIALQKLGSSTIHYFIGQAINLLSSYITVNDSSLIEIIKKPQAEVSTSSRFYNSGNPKDYLHEGNYSNYALPLGGGTLTGTLTSSNITPRTSVTYNIGTTSAYYNNICAQYFKRKDSSDSYVLLGGGGHKLLSELSGTHTHPWTDITEVPKILPGVAKAWFVPGHPFSSDLNAYISTINNRLYSADVRYTVSTSNISGPIHQLFNNNYDNYCTIAAGATGTITIEGFNWIYPTGYIFISFYNTAIPQSAKVTITYNRGNNTRTIGRSPIEPNGVWAFQIGINYLTKIEIQLTAPEDKETRVTQIDYSVTRTDNNQRDTAIVTNYTSNTLLYQLTAPKYIVTNGTSSQFLKADGSLDSTSYLPTAGGTLGSSSANTTELRTQSSTAALRIMSYSDSTNYIQSGNSSFDGNATLKITGYSNVTGTNLHFKFNNIYCRDNDYINIDSGNYNSYALPLSGGTMTGTLNTANIYPKANAGFNIGSTSSYYNTMYAYYFKKYGSDDNYLLLGGGGHKRVSDFLQIQDKGIEGGSSGNTDNWVLVLNNNYSTGWYGPCTMFYIRSKNFGCGILCFYHYWNTEGTSGYYDNSVWFFGAEHSAYSGTMGGTGRDINNYLKVYIDKENADLKIYYNRYNNQALNVQELQFVHGPSGTLYPSGELRASHFINSTQVVELPTTSNTFVNIPIQTVKNHTEDIKTTRSVYASAFYENSDIRLKENVHSIDQIDLLKKVDLVQFNFKNNQNKKYGVIAQQLEQVGLNNLVYEHNGNKAVDYISLLVLETQRLRNEIKELKEKLDKKELSS